jgi:hypothetical protein
MHVPEVTTPVPGVQIQAAPTMVLFVENGRFSLGEVGTPGPFTGAYDPVADAWWRIGESAGSFVFETSPTGVSWIERGSIPITASYDDIGIAFGAGTYLPVASPGRARFRCFNQPPPCT